MPRQDEWDVVDEWEVVPDSDIQIGETVSARPFGSGTPQPTFSQPAQEQAGNWLTSPLGVGQINIPENLPWYQKLPGEIYNRFVPKSPLDIGLAALGGPAFSKVAQVAPKVIGAGLAGLGVYGASQVPGDVIDYVRDPSTGGAFDIAEHSLMAGGLPFSRRFFNKAAPKPKVDILPPEEPGIRGLLPAPGYTTPTETRFVAGQHGIADAENAYLMEPIETSIMQPKPDPRTGRFTGKFATPNLTRFNYAAPEMAAERGVGFGMRQQVLDPGIDNPVLTSLLPSAARKGVIIDQPNVVSGVPFTRPDAPKLAYPAGGGFPPKPPIAKITDEVPVPKQPKTGKKWQEGQDAFAESWNLSRGLKASLDLSAPLRQGFDLAHKKQYWQAFDDMFRSLGSENGYKVTMDSIKISPKYELGQKVGLKLSDLGPLNGREEQLMSTWAETGIPLGNMFRPGTTGHRIGNTLQESYAKTVGRGVRASNRAYVGFLNKLRQDTFDDLVAKSANTENDANTNMIAAKALADYVNNATGRGTLRATLGIPGTKFKHTFDAERNAVLLNSMFFSPRFIASRINMLNPGNYIHRNLQVRKEYWKSLIPTVAMGTTMVALGAGGVGDVETDMRSSDFGKLRIGNVRLDPYAGHQQYITLISKLLSGQSKSTSTQNITNLGSSPVAMSPGELFLDMGTSPNRGFIGNKLHPMLTFGMDFAKLYRSGGFNIPEQTMNLFIPMVAQDLMELAKENPAYLPLGIPATFGMGVDVYGNRFGGNRTLNPYQR